MLTVISAVQGGLDPIADSADAAAIARAGAIAEAGAAEETLPGTMAVIGRRADTAAYENVMGYEVLNVPDEEWSFDVNDQFVKSVADRRLRVKVTSDITENNLYNDAGEVRPFGRELVQLTQIRGYTWDGWTLVPPGGG